jgi:hypothetical protein
MAGSPRLFESSHEQSFMTACPASVTLKKHDRNLAQLHGHACHG